MKKQLSKKIYIITLVILAIALISASAVGFTMAKFYTSVSADDDARVARWGITAGISTENPNIQVFNKTYNNGNPLDASATFDVVGTNGTVAPGTSGAFNVFATGKAEVSAKITYTLNNKGAAFINWKLANGSEYIPIVWTVEEKIDDGEFTKVLDNVSYDDFYTYFVQTKSNEAFLPNVSFNREYKISWVWSYVGNNDGDTYLVENAHPSINFDFTVTIDQTTGA